MPGELEGRVAIVTGGGRGFGQDIARGLAVAGAAVTVTARTESQLAETVSIVEAVGGRCLAAPAEITDQAAVDRVVAETEAKFGPVDILISNAAITTPVGPLWEIDPDSWDRTLDVNLIGPMRIAHTVLKGMVRGGGGATLSSSAAAPAPSPDRMTAPTASRRRR